VFSVRNKGPLKVFMKRLFGQSTSVPRRTDDCLALRELSATCFWGDSKFLDQREDLLASLFPDLLPGGRTQLLQVLLPRVNDGLLFVENQATFVRACLGRLAGAERLAIVYGAGFRAASEGVRQRDGVLFAFVDVMENAMETDSSINSRRRHLFESAWFDPASTLPVHFFGDLDDAGMAILAGLRRQFPQAVAWQPGYGPLVSALLSGGGHPPERAGKMQQKPVSNTGCLYADNVLIPAMRQTGRYLDQEYQPA
jgi:hypothetical protein